MSVPEQYLNSVGNVPSIFEAIRGAGVPPRFSYEFLKQLGFASSNDRSVIPVMKALRFLDDNSVPTDRYNRYRDPSLSGAVMAEALRDAYADLFTVKADAQTMNAASLQGAFKRITGKGDAVAKKMASTFRALTSLADWDAKPPSEPIDGDGAAGEGEADSGERDVLGGRAGAELNLRHDIHIHLPVTTDVKVYDAVFRSLREHFG